MPDEEEEEEEEGAPPPTRKTRQRALGKDLFIAGDLLSSNDSTMASVLVSGPNRGLRIWEAMAGTRILIALISFPSPIRSALLRTCSPFPRLQTDHACSRAPPPAAWSTARGCFCQPLASPSFITRAAPG